MIFSRHFLFRQIKKCFAILFSFFYCFLHIKRSKKANSNDRKKKGLKDLSYEDFIYKLDVLSSKVKGTLNFDLVDKNYYKHKLYKLPIYETATELNRKEETLGYYAEAFGDILEVVE